MVMQYFDITTNIKRIILETQKINNAVDRATKAPIVKSLAFLRRRMRTQLRRRKNASTPNKPASVHSTDPVATLKNILFAYDNRTKSGIVGPVKLNTVANRRNSEPLPGLLESGGIVSFPAGSLFFPRWKKKLVKSTKSRRVRISKRPNAAIALKAESEAGNILSPWANVVSG